MQALRVMYVVGMQLPPDSPCFTGMDDACKASLAAIRKIRLRRKLWPNRSNGLFPPVCP